MGNVQPKYEQSQEDLERLHTNFEMMKEAGENYRRMHEAMNETHRTMYAFVLDNRSVSYADRDSIMISGLCREAIEFDPDEVENIGIYRHGKSQDQDVAQEEEQRPRRTQTIPRRDERRRRQTFDRMANSRNNFKRDNAKVKCRTKRIRKH